MANVILDAVVLPPLSWIDEFDWGNVKAQQEYSLSGGLIIQESQVSAGRPITLESGDDYAWVKRTEVLALLAKLNTLNAANMTLTFSDGRVFSVRFDRSGETAVKAVPLLPWKGATAGDYYKLTLKLIQV